MQKVFLDIFFLSSDKLTIKDSTVSLSNVFLTVVVIWIKPYEFLLKVISTSDTERELVSGKVFKNCCEEHPFIEKSFPRTTFEERNLLIVLEILDLLAKQSFFYERWSPLHVSSSHSFQTHLKWHYLEITWLTEVHIFKEYFIKKK